MSILADGATDRAIAGGFVGVVDLFDSLGLIGDSAEWAKQNDQKILAEAQRCGANNLGRLACLIVSMYHDHQEGYEGESFRAFSDPAAPPKEDAE